MRAGAGLLLLMLLAGCREAVPARYQGYVEGEFVRVAAARAGRLDALAVSRGGAVQAGQPLFTLESGSEQAAVAEAAARLADLGKGQRPEELAAIRAQLRAAGAQQALSEQHWRRQRQLHAGGTISRERLEESAARRRQDSERVQELQARLRAAGLAARDDALRAAEAALAQAQWQLGQKAQTAPVGGLVDEVYFRVGEWVPAGMPVVSLLPPEARKLRFFVPEMARGGLQPGRRLQATCDGCGEPVSATIRHIAASAEFTPPVIYSREQRSRLVFLVEAQPEAAGALRLPPGQPVDIELLP